MDPLGAPSQFVDVDTLLSWGDLCEDELNSSDTATQTVPEDTIRSPFLYNKDINGKVVLWKGDVALLNCTAIVNTSNESLTDKNPVSESIFMLAGPDLKEDLQKLKGCRTGEAKLTKDSTWLPGSSFTQWDLNIRAATAQQLRAPCTAATEMYFSWQKSSQCLPLDSVSSILQNEVILWKTQHT